MVIRASDRVAQVLQRDPRLVQTFVAVSPHFERLRNPAMRRVMARLVTVEQAARIAGVEPRLLVERLNRELREPAATRESDEAFPRCRRRKDADCGTRYVNRNK